MTSKNGLFDAVGLKFHHCGLGTRNPSGVAKLLEGLGYTVGETVYDANQNAHLCMATAPDAPSIEVISPGEGDNPLAKILNKFQAGVYHLCYETEDVEGALEKLKQIGIRAVCAGPAKNAILFGGDPVSFYHVVDFGLIEIIHRPKR